MRTFASCKAKLYKFLQEDGSSRNVIALYTGSKRAGFIELSTVDDLIRQLEKLRDECQVAEVCP